MVLVAAAVGLYAYLRAPSGVIISSDEQLQTLNAPAPSGNFSLPQVKWLANGKLDLSGPIEYKVFFGSADGPAISKIVFAPYDVKPGDTQNIYAIAADQSGVSSLAVSIKNDAGVDDIPLKLVQGDAKSGVWQGSWKVHDLHAGYYPATFAVASVSGATRSTSAVFMDSLFSSLFGEIALASNYGAEQCSINATGSWAWSNGTCSVTSTDAVVGGNITITAVPGPTVLSIAPSITFGFSSGYSISICASGCSITIGTGGKIMKMGVAVAGVTYNDYVEDRDGDKYWDAQAVTSTNPYGAGGYLRASSTQLGLLGGGDCYDTGTGSTSTHPGQIAYFTTARGDGSYDYNCDASQTQEYANYETCFGITPQATCQNTHLNGTDWDSHAGSIPACGVAGSWINTAETCLWVTSPGCYDTTSSYTQPCR